MTPKYLVMIEQALVANSVKLLASKVQGKSLKDCLEWHPKERNRIHLVNKDGGRVIKTAYLTDRPFFFLNHVNAFEDGAGNVVVDVVGYDSPDVVDCTTVEKLRNGGFKPKVNGLVLFWNVFSFAFVPIQRILISTLIYRT